MIFEGFQTFSGLQNWFLEEEFRDDDSKTDFLGKNLEIIVKKVFLEEEAGDNFSKNDF